jgi:hypothetical protein
MSHGRGPFWPNPEARDSDVHIERPDGSWIIVIVNLLLHTSCEAQPGDS